MKKLFFIIMALLTYSVSNAQKTIVNDANAEVRSLNESFHSIKISGGIDLYLSQYETESIAVSASADKYKNDIKTVVENGVLRIYFDGNNWNGSGNKKLKVYVSFKNLDRLQASGACDVQVAGNINVPDLSLSMSGASEFKGAVSVNKLSLDLSGASDAKISGTAATVNIESSGASDVKGYELITENCTVRASGASDVNITVNKEMKVSASGASDIFYKGDCVIKEIHSSGASTFNGVAKILASTV